MKSYSVTIKEVFERVVTVEAESKAQAYEKASNGNGLESNTVHDYAWTLDPDIDCDVTELTDATKS